MPTHFDALRKLMYEAMTLMSQCDMFMSDVKSSEGEIHAAYTVLYEKHAEKLRAKMNDISICMKDL
jgi:hypothetical protein